MKTNDTKTFGPKKRPVTDSQSFSLSGLKKQVLPFTLGAVSMPGGLPGPPPHPQRASLSPPALKQSSEGGLAQVTSRFLSVQRNDRPLSLLGDAPGPEQQLPQLRDLRGDTVLQRTQLSQGHRLVGLCAAGAELGVPVPLGTGAAVPWGFPSALQPPGSCWRAPGCCKVE